jgi:translation initiation factor IF-1
MENPSSDCETLSRIKGKMKRHRTRIFRREVGI